MKSSSLARIAQNASRVFRLWLLNRCSGVSIASSVRWASTARVDLAADGYSLGGTVTVGSRSRIGHGVVLAPYGGSIEIGEDVFIGPYCVLYGHGGLVIEDHAMIAAHSVLVPANHVFTDLLRPIALQGTEGKGIHVETDVWIGTGVRVLDGVTIRRGAVVGAGSVVTHSLPAESVAVGVPARVIRQRGIQTPDS